MSSLLNLVNSVESAENLRKQGNQKFKEDNYFDALNLYNRALVAIKEDDPNRLESIALCYANRSAVYLEKKYFKLCLDNIERAEKHYPRDNIQKLHDRRQKCIELMKTEKDHLYESYENPYKLSYEPNPKLPFFIDSLELKKDAKTEVHIITTRDLKAGDIIAVFDNCLSSRYPETMTCHNCLNLDNFNLKLYDGCNEGEEFNSMVNVAGVIQTRILFPFQLCFAAINAMKTIRSSTINFTKLRKVFVHRALTPKDLI
jgi:tetratricopeptide (TPR) repeat protein